jgi:hypothetical protein
MNTNFGSVVEGNTSSRAKGHGRYIGQETPKWWGQKKTESRCGKQRDRASHFLFFRELGAPSCYKSSLD